MFSSSRISDALPPPKSSRKVWRKHWSISLKRSLKTCSISLVISVIIPRSSFLAFSTSSLCSLKNS
ncbi:secreted protein [gut metagenome]|uniref:Secreted protein n=1 Tax=gut metagenome TaxID=749906 RepID=J9FS63_9ZZZZ